MLIARKLYICNSYNLTKNKRIMISQKLQDAINAQIVAEMWSANLYLSMSYFSLRKAMKVLLHG